MQDSQWEVIRNEIKLIHKASFKYTTLARVLNHIWPLMAHFSFKIMVGKTGKTSFETLQSLLDCDWGKSGKGVAVKEKEISICVKKYRN